MSNPDFDVCENEMIRTDPASEGRWRAGNLTNLSTAPKLGMQAFNSPWAFFGSFLASHVLRCLDVAHNFVEVNQGYMAHDVFISHARKDKGIADAICEKLECAERKMLDCRPRHLRRRRLDGSHSKGHRLQSS